MTDPTQRRGSGTSSGVPEKTRNRVVTVREKELRVTHPDRGTGWVDVLPTLPLKRYTGSIRDHSEVPGAS